MKARTASLCRSGTSKPQAVAAEHLFGGGPPPFLAVGQVDELGGVGEVCGRDLRTLGDRFAPLDRPGRKERSGGPYGGEFVSAFPVLAGCFSGLPGSFPAPRLQLLPPLCGLAEYGGELVLQRGEGVLVFRERPCPYAPGGR